MKTVTIVALLFLAACSSEPRSVSSIGEVCASNDPLWDTCMAARKRGRHPPAEMQFTDWRGR